MRMARICFAALVLGVASISLSGAASAQDVTNTLKVRYNPDTAVFQVNGSFGRTLRGPCRLIIKASISYEGDSEPTALRRLLDYRFSRKNRVKLQVANLPGVTANEDGDPPFINVQSRLTCKNQDIDETSNADARYVNCGEGQQDVIPVQFLQTLNAGLRAAADAEE